MCVIFEKREEKVRREKADTEKGKMFSGKRAWFSPNVSADTLQAWTDNGGLISNSFKEKDVTLFFADSAEEQSVQS